jgi:hypothetical protein
MTAVVTESPRLSRGTVVEAENASISKSLLEVRELFYLILEL